MSREVRSPEAIKIGAVALELVEVIVGETYEPVLLVTFPTSQVAPFHVAAAALLIESAGTMCEPPIVNPAVGAK